MGNRTLRSTDMPEALGLLTLLDPGGSRYIAEMQNTGRRRSTAEQARAELYARLARSKACPKCRGRGQVKRSPKPDDWMVCPRCDGRRTIAETGGMTSTRTAKASTEAMTAADVACMLAHVSKHKVDAALVYVNDDGAAQERVERDVLRRIIIPASREWAIRSENRAEQLEWLAWFALTEVRMHAGRRVKARHTASRLGVPTATWYSVWRPRHEEHVGQLLGWVSAVGSVLQGQIEAARSA